MVNIWKAKSKTVIFINFGNKNKSPINISNNPNQIINWLKDISGRVLLRSSPTKGFAGLSPKTFRDPNQKYIINKEALDSRKEKFSK